MNVSEKSGEISEGLGWPWNVYQIVHGDARAKLNIYSLTSDKINSFMFAILGLDSVNKFPAVFFMKSFEYC